MSLVWTCGMKNWIESLDQGGIACKQDLRRDLINCLKRAKFSEEAYSYKQKQLDEFMQHTLTNESH